MYSNFYGQSVSIFTGEAVSDYIGLIINQNCTTEQLLILDVRGFNYICRYSLVASGYS